MSSRQDAFVVRLDGEFGRFNRSMNARGTELKNEIATMLETMVQGTEESIEKIEGQEKELSELDETVKNLQRALNVQLQKINQISKEPRPARPASRARSGRLGEKSKDLGDFDFEDATEVSKRFDYIEYEVDLITNDLDKLGLNKTMETLESVQNRLLEIESAMGGHLNHHQGEFERMNKQMDSFINDSISFDDQLKMRMTNIENAYRLFNLTNDFQFNDLRSKLKKVSTDQTRMDQRITSISKGRGDSASLEGTVQALKSKSESFEKQQNLVRANIDVLNRKLDRTNEKVTSLASAIDSGNTIGQISSISSSTWSEWSQWSECSVTCDSGIETRSRICPGVSTCTGSDLEERACMVAPCDCWTEWNNWSTCTKSCGRGLMKRTREKNMRSTQRCIGSAEETSVCNTESCDEERRILVLGGRGLYMQEQSIINTATGTELQRRERSFHKFAMHCTAALNKKVFIIGGYYSRRYIHSISDAECNVEKMPITLPMDYMRHSCTNHNGKIWICGTYKEPNRCDSFNGYQMRMEPSTRQRHSSGMLVSVPSRGLMILGGSGKSGRNKAVEILVGRNWQTGPDLPTEISLASAQAIGEDLFIFGGQGSSRKTNSVYKLARGREKWEEITPKLRNVRASHMSVLVGSKVYLIGGQGDLPVEVWEENRRSTRELSQISHKNRLYTSATVLPSNVCSAFRNN